jgi:hypothetical protein
MYPSGELARLADRKVLLQARIAVRRLECVAAAIEVCKPIGAIDRGLAVWHRISPFLKVVGVPLALMVARILSRKRKGKPTGKSKFAAVLTALPLIMRGINMVKDARAAHAAHRAHRQAATDPRLKTPV